ncbi:glycosyltransferase [Kitasatospora sp. NPDC006697]|uniref:glycosyltransferase n=1 Tax=Kitasatospora sp. NPDC006697 TaxID=3364020 RepID=UPI0036829CD7
MTNPRSGPLRVLLVVPPLAGHVHPAIALADELAARGHQVAWAGDGPVLRGLLGPADQVISTGSRLFRPQGGSGTAAIRTLWEGFVLPNAKFTRRGLERAIADWRPDLLLVDQHTPMGALLAQRHGLPWISLAPSAMELGEPLERDPELAGWLPGLLRELSAQVGIPAAAYQDPRFSPRLVLAFTGRELAGPAGLPPQVALVGPLLGRRPAAPDFPWERLDPDRVPVLVTLGTLAAEVAGDFHRRAAEALRPLAGRVQGIVAAPPQVLAGLPEFLIGVERFPLLDLLARTRPGAVLCHAGMNTVMESLAHGVPLVLAPIRHDQPIAADQVERAGAGLVVDFTGADPAELRRALTAVLDQPGYRAAAERISRSFPAEGGARTAVDAIEETVVHLS